MRAGLFSGSHLILPAPPGCCRKDPLENPVRCACACNAEGGAGCRLLSFLTLFSCDSFSNSVKQKLKRKSEAGQEQGTRLQRSGAMSAFALGNVHCSWGRKAVNF